MLYPLQFIIDGIFPPSKHELTLRAVSHERFIHWYQPTIVSGVVCLSEYKLPEVQAAVAACKFEHSYHAAKLLSTHIELYLKSLPFKSTLLIPVPLSAKRGRRRQFNQVERVLRSINSLPDQYKIATNILTRNTDTRPQTSLHRTERLKNLHGAFSIHTSNLYKLDKIERIIICDDVMTTGATLYEAEKVLRAHVSKNVEIVCVGWAH